MPNWCVNQMTISHRDRAMIDKAVEAWNSGDFLSKFIPVPYELTLVGGARIDVTKITNRDHHNELEQEIRKLNVKYFGFADWYDFCINNWGTKWDIGAEAGEKIQADGDTFTVRFSSAWSPPVTAYERLGEMGFIITAYYYEPGMQFCGRWDDGADDCIRIPDTIDEAKKVIPLDIDDAMCIIETMQGWEEHSA